MTDRREDGELIERALAGDELALGALVRRYLRPALATAWEYSDSLEDAEDLVQEAFIRALGNLRSFDPSKPFGRWFFTILRNRGRTAAARRGRWAEVPFPEELPSGEVAQDEAVEALEARERIDDLLEGLSPMQRTCIRLVDLEGFKGREVAAMLGVSLSTVRVHVHRARRTLRSRVVHMSDGDGS